MANYDHGEALYKEQCADKYTELKKHISSQDKEGKLNQWFLAYQHMVDLENRFEKQKTKLEEYQKLFRMFNDLLP